MGYQRGGSIHLGVFGKYPISPYLFLICVEALSSLLARADSGSVLRGGPSSSGVLASTTYFLLTIVYCLKSRFVPLDQVDKLAQYL
jgi:hypothetical protein